MALLREGSYGGFAADLAAASLVLALFLPANGAVRAMFAIALSFVAVAIEVAVCRLIQASHSGQPLAWYTSLCYSAPALATIVIAQGGVMDTVTQVKKATQDLAERLGARVPQIKASQDSVVADLERLSARIDERSTELARIQEEFRFYSEFSLAGLIRPVLELWRKMDAFTAERPVPAGSEAEDLLIRCTRRVEQMLGAIYGFRTLGEVGSADLHFEPVNFSELAIKVAAELHDNAPTREIEWIIDPDITLVADLRLGERAMRHLMENALHFARQAPHPKVEIRSVAIDGVPGFSVGTNGPGFDEYEKLRLFEPFYRSDVGRQISGAGVGLSTVRQIVDRHGGTIEADSEVGKGATIRVTFGARISQKDVESMMRECLRPLNLQRSTHEGRQATTSLPSAALVHAAILVMTACIAALAWSSPPGIAVQIARVAGATVVVLIAAYWLSPRSASGLGGSLTTLPLTVLSLAAWSLSPDLSECFLIAAVAVGVTPLILGMKRLLWLGILECVAFAIGFWGLTTKVWPPLSAPPSPISATLFYRAPILLAGSTLLLICGRALAAAWLAANEERRLCEEYASELNHASDSIAESEGVVQGLEQLLVVRTRAAQTAADSLDSFAGMVSHDIRGPIRSVHGLLHILEEEQASALGHDGIETLREFQEQMHAIHMYVEELISVGQALRRESNTEYLDLAGVLERAARKSSQNPNARVDQGISMVANPKLAELALERLLDDVQSSGGELVFMRSPTSGGDGVFALGCSGGFLDTVERFQTPGTVWGAGEDDTMKFLKPLAFVRLCRKQGGAAWVETGEDGERRLRFNFASEHRIAISKED